MSSQNVAIGVGALVVLAIGLVVWTFAGGGGAADGKEATETVLCANPKCGHSGELPASQLAAPSSGKEPARMPADGPGYKCPKCGQDTLYPGAIKCDQCGTLYLMSRDAGGRRVARCPKCETSP